MFAAPIAAQAAEGTDWQSSGVSLTIDAGGIASADQTLSYSETVEETVLAPDAGDGASESARLER